jgi:long-subunit fatty acid transport protein
MKRYTLGLALLGLAGPLFAQNQDDALRYSRLQFGGPARTLGIAGANVALGADFGNLSSNPAGLGLFQRSEVSFSPGLGLGNADARAANLEGASSISDSRNSLHLGNLSVAFTGRRTDDEGGDWRGGTLAFGFTRVNDFNTRFSYRNTLPDSRSLFQRFREPRFTPASIDNEYATNNYTSLDGLAYGALLTNIESVNGQDAIVTPTPLQRTSALQEESVLTSGSQTQFDIGYGGSYRDRLYIGGAVGIVSTRFNSTSELQETDPAQTSRAFGSLELRDELRTRGTGYNFRLGLIYRPLDWFRIGVSAQTPTAFQLDDTYSTSLYATFRQPVMIGNDSYTTGNAATQEARYSYRLTTPWRLNGGVAAVIGKYGFLSGDVEMVDYSQARLRNASELQDGDTYSFSNENARIAELYKSALNVRLGGELRLDAFRVRAGYARYGDPFRNSRFDRNQTYYTAGLGLRQGSLSLDLAGVYNQYDRVYSPYTLADGSQPEIRVDASRFTSTLTLGYQF